MSIQIRRHAVSTILQMVDKMEQSLLKTKLIQLIHSVVSQSALQIDGLSENDYEALYKLASMHDVAHIVGYAVIQSRPLMTEETFEMFAKKYYLSFRRIATQESAFQKIQSLFEENDVDFIPLKGQVIRTLYPVKWMRLSTDIDILVKKNDLDRAVLLLANRLGYSKIKTEAHDVAMRAPNGGLLELHFSLTERLCKSKEILDDVWNQCFLKPGTKHEFCMRDAFLYYYHMFHAAKHFQLGGCGIRTVLDTWVLNHISEEVDKNRKELLDKGGLLTFSRKIEDVAEKWFSKCSVDSFDEVEQFIISGGTFGKTQLVAAVQAKKGGRRAYILERLFPPIKKMKIDYSILSRMPLLLPFCWIHRLITSFFSGKTKKGRYELEQLKKNTQRSTRIAEMFRDLDLS